MNLIEGKLPKSLQKRRSWRRLFLFLRRYGFVEFVLFAVLACAATWPLAKHLSTSLPVGTEPAATVPLLNCWSVWWNADRAAHRFEGYWQAPIFHPLEDTFAYSEAQPTTLIVAPLVYLSDRPITAYNVYLLLCLTLNGHSAFQLLRAAKLRYFAALAGGAMMVTLPYVHEQLGVAQLIPLFGVIWTIHASYLFGRRATLPRALLIGVSFAMTYASCNYHGLFFAVLGSGSLWWLWGRSLFAWRSWAKLFAAAVTAAILLAPIVRVQLRASKNEGFDRQTRTVQKLSAVPKDYLATPWKPWGQSVYRRIGITQNIDAKRSKSFPLSPGYFKVLLAVAGLGYGIWKRQFRFFTLFWLSFFVIAVLFSFGLNVELSGVRPYEWIMVHVPGFHAIRSIARFAFFVQMAIVFLAAQALDGVWRIRPTLLRVTNWKRKRESERNRNVRWLRHAPYIEAAIVFFVFAVFSVGEVWPAKQSLYRPEEPATQLKWLQYVRDELPPDAPIVCIPLPDGRNATAYEGTGVWMYWGSFHHRRMVNGYSGFFPEHFIELKEPLKEFPNSLGLKMLRDLGVEYCVVRREVADPNSIANDPFTKGEVEWLFGDAEAKIDVYRILPQ